MERSGTATSTDTIVAAVLDRAAEQGIDPAWLKDEVVEFYRDLHRYPELSGTEYRTQWAIGEALAVADVWFQECTPSGLVAVLRNGPGPVVWVRADTDALPLTEQTGLPYASTVTQELPDGSVVGVMHACGHDVHTAALVGCLRQLDRERDGWSGTVVGIFQPAEETGRGALAMLDELLNGEPAEHVPRPDVVYAQHVTSAPLGRVVCRPGWFLSHQRSWRVTVQGRGGHASRPHLARDPIVAAASMVGALQTVVSRAVDPFRMAVLTVGTFHAGTKENIIPSEAVFTVSARTYEPEVSQVVEETMRRILEGEAAAHGVSIRIEEVSDIPACYNDPAATSQVADALTGVFGDDVVAPPDPFPAADDFCHYARVLGVPAVIWNFGVQAAELFDGDEPPPRNHDARFAPHPEHAVTLGVVAATRAVTNYLRS